MRGSSRPKQFTAVLLFFAGVCAARCSLDESGRASADSGALDVNVADVSVDDSGPEGGPDDADSGPPVFDPSAISDLQLWFRTDHALSIDGGRVTNWRDYSGKNDTNRDLAPGALVAPAIIDAGFGAAVYFNANEGLRTGLIVPPLTTPISVFIVAGKAPASAPTSPVYLFDSLAPTAQLSVLSGASGVFGTSNVLQEFAGQPGAAANVVVTAPMDIIAVFNGTSSMLLQDSNSSDAAATSPGPTSSISGVTIGNYSGATSTSYDYGFSGYVAEFAVYAHVLTAPEIAALNGYAAQRYGIVIGN